jgi:prostaglandin-H2 D-isomerase
MNSGSSFSSNYILSPQMAGKWWAVGFATNAKWFMNRKAGMKMGTSMMLPTAGGDLDISSTNQE